MPLIPFDALPDDSRTWIFATDHPLETEAAGRLLEEVDAYLEQWKVHGEPLQCARRWVDDHFLLVGVDSSTANASGCSIDGLFRALQRLEPVIGTRLVGGGRIGYRDAAGGAHVVARDEFAQLANAGEVTRETPVFDTSLTTAGEIRDGFERPAGESWAATYFRG